MSILAFVSKSPDSFFATGSKGWGTDYLRLTGLLNQAKSARDELGGTPQSAALVDLARLAREYKTEGWDGYAALPVDAMTIEHVRMFVESLPTWLPAPEVVPESDGEIALEWNREPNRVFSVSVGKTAMLHYAGLFGKGVERHGVEPFSGVVSQEILRYIQEVAG